VPVFKKSSPLGRLGSGSRVVGRLRSGVWVSASFQIFPLTAGREIVRAGKMSRWEYVRGGKCPGGNVPQPATKDAWPPDD